MCTTMPCTMANRGHCVLLGDTEYARAVILHTRTMMYHEACPRLPFTDMFTEDVGTFSEEAGEIAISVTTRYTLGDHTADKLQHKQDVSIHRLVPGHLHSSCATRTH